jgi:pimeloyl-ACP methyl ester carboxylesterase
MRRLVGAVVLLLTVVATSCASADDPSDRSSAPPTETASVSSSAGTVEGTFDVGGHELYIRCTGSGSPTVLYLHGYIFDPSGGGSENAGEIPGLLEDQHEVCVYDRANVGKSDTVEGPLTASSSVEDLDALLDAAGIEGPYLLIGASFGGLLAYSYAATYPDDVVGMVLLDPNLPGFDDGPFDWEATTEQLDQAVASRDASKLEGQEPAIPVTLIAPEKPEIVVSSAEEYAATKARILAAQRRFLDRFPEGELVIVDAPHYMEPVIPDRIADEVIGVAGRA